MIVSSRSLSRFSIAGKLQGLRAICSALALFSIFGVALMNGSESKREWSFTAEDDQSADFQIVGATRSTENPGGLIRPIGRSNSASLRFDGKTNLLLGPPSDSADLKVNFTWEGYFLLAGGQKVSSGSNIGRRLITQFADDGGSITRLTIGLVGDGKKQAWLCVAYDGTDDRILTGEAAGRTFGRGSIEVVRDIWHHFALVHEGTEDAATISWYLDGRRCGTLFLGGVQNPNKLRPGGRAPLAIGGVVAGQGKVKGGFEGWLDEIRLSGRALVPEAFLAVYEPKIDRSIAFSFHEDIEKNRFDWHLERRPPDETIHYEGLALGGVPPRFGHSGFIIPRNGRIGVTGEATVTLTPGRHRLLLVARNAALLAVDGKIVIDARGKLESEARGEPARHEAEFISEGGDHRVVVAAIFDGAPKEQTQELMVGHAVPGSPDWKIVGTTEQKVITPPAWAAYKARSANYVESLVADRRRRAMQRGDEFWRRRHKAARQAAAKWPAIEPSGEGHAVDALLSSGVPRTALATTTDAVFIRRLSLDVRGRIPTRAEVKVFLADVAPDKRTRLVESYITSDEWADGWMGFWQDALAESPSVVYPTLGNSGPFRRFLHDAFRTNLPMDRFVTDLMLMDGSEAEGGSAGFALAQGIDTPAAMKAHIVLKTFLGADLRCAKCHDSPIDEYTQTDLFSIASFLNDGPLTISEANVAATKPGHGGHQPLVETALKPGDVVPPAWTMASLTTGQAPAPELVVQPGRPRAELGAWITSPDSPRFSEVFMSLLWDRYFKPPTSRDLGHESRSAVIRYLAKRFTMENYDLKAMARLLLTSTAYAAETRSGDDASTPWFQRAARRLSAEQIVDSLFVAVGKRFEGEVLALGATDPGAVNLERPERAWQFTALPNERDRPALGMPVLQTIEDVLTTFGWPAARLQPQLERDDTTTALQPLLLFNGLLSQRIVRLSDASAITELCLEDLSSAQMVDELSLMILSRPAAPRERAVFTELIEPGFNQRRTGQPKGEVPPLAIFQPDWKKHLQSEQTLLMMEAQKRVAAGEPPTARLSPDWRERAEDVVWAMINTPEFLFVP